ncbi:3-oxoadipate enol-lactonase [Rhizobium sp. KVB221]|uniref:3-oxoadipate enol-lactonase n=1 Tax=Rhizobium setariae TaxID=2801340 RepID=A0A936YLJ6_9HYPH|nr:3-oxoadipate enol-lactonase [Rhizobium setariae]MBL0371778.1 3-oxoadipate enol-lactonase [Rhizobium setariae]
MAFADINGITLHYEYLTEYEDEPVVVFSNSLGTDFRIWLPLIDELTDNWSILVYDKRGHGLSDVGTAPYTIEDHADDLIGLTAHLGIKKAIFVGLSVGGLIVQSVYAKKPGLVQKIVLCDTAHKIGTADMWNGRIETARTAGIGSMADAILERWFTKDFRDQRKADLSGYRNMLTRQSVEGYAGTCAAIRDADFTEAARKIKVPTLCIVGDQDGSTPPDVVRATADLISGADFEIIENAGHIPCVEQPAALAELLADFINED